MAGHNSKTLMYDFPPKVWKRFRDDLFVVWTHDTGRIKFTMQIADDLNRLEFLDLIVNYQMFILSLQIVSPALCHQRAIQ